MMAYLLAEAQHGLEHHRARDRKHTYACLSLLVSDSLPIRPPGFNHEDSHVTNLVTKASPLNVIVGLSFYDISTSQLALNFNM